MKKNLVMILWFLLLQSFFYGTSKWFGYSRPFILMEYTIPILLLHWLGWKKASILILPILILEVWLAVAQVYLLYKPIQWLYMLKYIGYLRNDFLIYLTIFLFIIIVLYILLFKMSEKYDRIKVFSYLFLV